MKLVKYKTGHIIIRAQTTSVTDDVDFAVIAVTDDFIKMLLSAVEDAKKLSEKYGYQFHNISLWRMTDGWFRQDQPFELDGVGWSFVELDASDAEKFQAPEDTIGTEIIEIMSNGSFHFLGTGKWSSDEYWTNSVYINDIIKLWLK